MIHGTASPVVKITKGIPATSSGTFYPTLTSTSDDDIEISVSGGIATVSIYLYGVEQLSGQTKKSLIKIERPESDSTQEENKSDNPKRIVLDLNRVSDTLDIKAWLDDGPTYSAWQKLWMLRAMASSGNADGEGARLSELQVGGITFDEDSMQPHLETLTWKFKADGSEPQTRFTNDGTTSINDVARIEVGIDIYFGEDRFAAS